MSHTPARMLVVAAVALGVFAPPASAATICVPDASPGGCDSIQSTIHGAANAAESGDTIKIATGLYEESVNAGTKTLHFVGSSSGTTTIRPPTDRGDPALPALSLPRGGSVESLVAVGSGDPYVARGDDGVGIVFVPDVEGSFHLSLSDVTVGGMPAEWSGGGMVIAATAPTNARASIEDTIVVGGTGWMAGGIGVRVEGSGATVAFDRSVLKGGFGRPGQWSGLAVSGAAASLSRSDVHGGAGIAGGSLEIARGTITGNSSGSAGGAYATALSLLAPASVTLSDSVVRAVPGPAAADSETAAVMVTGSDAGAASLTALGSTFFAGGRDPDAGVLARRPADTNQPVTVDLRNSVVRLEVRADATDAELVADRVQITADFSAFTTVHTVNGGTAPAPGSALNVSGDPRFTDSASGDFSLLPGAPLVDRGDPAIVTPGQLDRAGNPRSTDGDGDCIVAPDIGAFERPEACGRPNITAFLIANRRFAPIPRQRAARRRGVKHGTRFRYTLSEPAALAITIVRLPSGRRVGVLRAEEQAGKQWRRFNGRLERRALRPGRYRARVVATDLQGARSRARRLTFRVVRP